MSTTNSEKKQNGDTPKVALLIDANSSRDIQTILKAYDVASKYGKILHATLYVEEKDLSLISTISNDLSRRGIEIRITTGPNEIVIALDAVELAYQNKVDYIIIVTRRDVLVPVFSEIKRLNKTLILLAPVSAPLGLKEIADEIHVI